MHGTRVRIAYLDGIRHCELRILDVGGRQLLRAEASATEFDLAASGLRGSVLVTARFGRETITRKAGVFQDR